MLYPESESSLIELKQVIPKSNQLVKTAIAFCNTYGGRIILGVADDRKITGIAEDDLEKIMELIDQTIYDQCSPNIIPRLYTQRFDDRVVLVIEIAEGMNKPYYLRASGLDKGVYIRIGRHTMQANDEVIQELQWQSKGIDFERLPVFQADMRDLDEKSIKSFIKQRKSGAKDTVNELVLKSYGIISYDQTRKFPSVLGILLFGKSPQAYFSEAMIICSHFRGNSGREVVATVDCEGTLIAQFEQAFSFLTQRLHKSFIIKNKQRLETLELPVIALREVLLNMLVHRNYYLKAPSKIAIYDDRVEFFSPGQFPGLISVDNLQAGITYLRNPAICKILREAGYIEKLGSGFITMFASFEKAGLAPPRVVEGPNYVKCIFPRGERLVEASNNSNIIQSDEEKIMALIEKQTSVSVVDVAQTLLASKPTALRRIAELIETKKLLRIGQGRNTRYIKNDLN